MKGRKIFDVTLWGALKNDEGRFIGECLFVNGIAAKVDDVFYDIIIPFLPEDAVKELEAYIGRRNPEEIMP